MLEKAAIVFHGLALIAGGGFAIGLAGRLAGRDPGTVLLVDLALAAIIFYLTAEGLLRQRRWAGRVGYVLGIALLFVFPTGTVLGVLVLMFLVRASRAGLVVPSRRSA